MILKNNSKALITIPTTPFRTKREAIETVKNGESLTYSQIDILPTKQQEVPDEFCNTDFVLNLLDIGELTRVMGGETVEVEEDEEDEPESLPRKTRTVKASKPAKPTKSTKAKADTKAELNAARDRADIAGISFKNDWTVAQIDAAIKNHKK
jgi:hypothetical protein